MRKNILKTLFVGAIVGATTVMIALPSFAANWKMEGKAWKYYTDDGKLVTGWVKDNNKWFYLDSKSGELKTGWFKDNTGKWYFLNPQSDGNKGAMLTGWQWIDGNCYYLNADGSMLANGETPDGYKVNADGKWTDANGNAVFIAGKGIETKLSSQGTSMLNANKKVSLRSSGGSGSSGGGGSHSTGSGSNIGNTADVDNNDKKPESKIEDKKNENKPENKTEAKNENNKPEIKDETKKEENKIETPKKEEKKQELSIKSYEKLADINVDNGLAKEELDKVLPKKVVLTLSDESKREVAITKVDTSKVDTIKAGEYELKVEYDLPEGVVGEKPGVNIKLIVAAPKEVKVESVASIEDVVVDYQMLKSEYEKLLPKKIVLNLNNGSTKEVAVVADSSTINTNEEAEYIVKLAYELPDGVVGEKPEASVKVIVTKPSIVGYTPIEGVTLEKGDGKNPYNAFPYSAEFILSNGQKKTIVIKVKKPTNGEDYYAIGKYTVHFEYKIPNSLKQGKDIDVTSTLTVTPKSTIKAEKEAYKETENAVLKFENRDILDTDIIEVTALKDPDNDYHYKDLEKGTDFTVNAENDTITMTSTEVLKKVWGNSAYASGKLNGDVKVYYEVKVRKNNITPRKRYEAILVQYKKAGEESVKPVEDDSNLELATVSGGIASTQNRGDTSYPVYVNTWDSLDTSKISQVKFYKVGTDTAIDGIRLVSEAFNDDDIENGTKSTVLKVPFSAIEDKLVDNKITLYGKGGGYKIKQFTITYEAQ